MDFLQIKLSEELIKDAKRFGEVYSRSVPKQIEYWSRIGKIAEANPELSYAIIKDILVAQQEAQDGETTPYKFG
jgi:hypothetical protein